MAKKFGRGRGKGEDMDRAEASLADTVDLTLPMLLSRRLDGPLCHARPDLIFGRSVFGKR